MVLCDHIGKNEGLGVRSVYIGASSDVLVTARAKNLAAVCMQVALTSVQIFDVSRNRVAIATTWFPWLQVRDVTEIFHVVNKLRYFSCIVLLWIFSCVNPVVCNSSPMAMAHHQCKERMPLALNGCCFSWQRAIVN
jgi:hypothetical protein